MTIFDEPFEPPTFDHLWSVSTRRGSKQSARKSWDRLSDADQVAAYDRMREDAPIWKRWPKDQWRFVPHVSTWLNGRRWEDEDRPQPVATSAQYVGAHSWQATTKIGDQQPAFCEACDDSDASATYTEHGWACDRCGGKV